VSQLIVLVSLGVCVGFCGCNVSESGCVGGFVGIVMWAEMEIFMHVCFMCTCVCRNRFCVSASPFSSVNSECSEISH